MANQEGLPLTEGKKPGFFYGYIIVLAAFFIMTLSHGAHYSFGIFFKPLLTEFGWTRAMTSGAFSLASLVQGSLGIVTGRLSDRFGARTAGIACGLLLGSGFLLMSQVNAVWQLYLFYGLLVGSGMSGVWVPLTSTVPRWFVGRRGLMTGIVVSGVGVGMVIFPPLYNWLIATYDWRTSYIIIGIIILVVIIFAARFLRRDPEQIGQLPYGESEIKPESLVSKAREFSFREAMRTRQFAMVNAIYFCFSFFLFTAMVHIVPYATDIGISAANAANILAIIGGISIVGRITMGSLSDRIGVKPSLIFTLILALVALFWLQAGKELWMLYLFAITFGFAYGGMTALQSLILAELFGLSSLGIMVGIISFSALVAGMIGPILAGHLFDITGSYQLSFLVSTVVSVAAVMIALFLKPTTSNGGGWRR